jgi:hypothetical protein
MSFLVKRDSPGCGNLPGMSPAFQSGIRFGCMPELYHDTPFCLGMPEVLA